MQVTDEERATFEAIHAKMAVDQKAACQEFVALFDEGAKFETLLADIDALVKRAVTGSQERQQLFNVSSVVQSVIGQMKMLHPVVPQIAPGDVIIDAPTS